MAIAPRRATLQMEHHLIGELLDMLSFAKYLREARVNFIAASRKRFPSGLRASFRRTPRSNARNHEC